MKLKQKRKAPSPWFTFVSLGPPLGPDDPISTKVAPADNMSITVALAGGAVVYKTKEHVTGHETEILKV